MKYIIGCDEVGYGAACCDLVVCAVKSPKDWNKPYLKDSKKLSSKKREEVNILLQKDNDIQFVIKSAPPSDIDKYGVYEMLKILHIEAIKSLICQDSFVIVDGNLKLIDDCLNADNYKSVVKADNTIHQTMAASIIAKVYRDNLMIQYDKLFPVYDWKSNKGYLSKNHKDGIRKYGLCDLHRKSYDIKV